MEIQSTHQLKNYESPSSKNTQHDHEHKTEQPPHKIINISDIQHNKLAIIDHPLANVVNNRQLNNTPEMYPSDDTDLSHFDINTDDSMINVNTDSTSHEFSIATLDRKLKKLKNHKVTIQRSFPPRDHEYESTLYFNKSNKNSSHNTTDIPLIDINPIRLINNHLKEIQLRIIGHTRAATIYENRDKIFGYPSTIISSFTSSTILMSITMNGDNDFNKKTIRYVSFIMSITSFFMSVSRNFLEYSKKYQSHDLSSKLYTTLLRSIEVRLISLNKEYTKRSLFKEIVDQMSIIEQYERPIPHNIDQKVRSENREMLRNQV